MNERQARLLAALGAVGTTGICDAALHGGPWGAFAVAAAGVAAWHGDVLVNATKSIVLSEEVEAVERFVEASPQLLHEDQRPLSKLKRLVVGLAPHHSIPMTTDTESDSWDESWYEEEDECLPQSISDGMFTFSQVLASGFTPSLNKIFLARLPDGTDVCVSAKDLCHVALAGLTGNGKGVIMRLIMAQLCKVGVSVLLLNPHYMPWDYSGDEDWTPYEPCLQKQPAECSGYATIKTYLRWMTDTLLVQRIERARQGKPIGKPFFIIIDELPAIVGEIKEAPGYIAKILREGRKYGIYLIIASQDFLVKTTGMDGGGVRKCFKTVFYVGGDVTTAKVLLNDSHKDQIPENDLGKGTVMLRCATTKDAVVARVPYVDNTSLYQLLGPSTFKKSHDPYAELAKMPDIDPIDPDDSRYPDAVEQKADRIKIGVDPIKKQDVTISREQFDMVVRMRKNGIVTGYRQLMQIIPTTETYAQNLNRLILAELEEREPDSERA